MKVPVLFIIFNRLDTTKRVFEEIKRAKPLRLYIASDGSRENKHGEKETVESVRKYVLDNIDWQCEVKTLFRDKNLGCKYAVSSAITWFFENEEMGIILEDDCLPSESFFKFCEEMLERYKDDERVGMISGFNPFSADINIGLSYFFSKYNLCWGWATWKTVWNNYDIEMNEWKNDRKSDLLKRFSKSYLVRKYWKYLFDIFYFKIDESGWDAQFSYLLFKDNKFSVVPSKNLIENIGYGSELSTHCINEAPEHISKAKREELLFPLKHNENVLTYDKFDGMIEKVHFNINFFTDFKLCCKFILGKNKKIRFFYNLSKIYIRK
ncbi:MAG: nucleotide-diphospho-sugar transferase [Elusimicrobia bacterium]|nr:nucleotide-diphospho-sugar transferase [Elusimicrobiota bacterium]